MSEEWIWARRNPYNFGMTVIKKRKVTAEDISEKEQMQFAKILQKLKHDLPLTEDELKILDKFNIDYKKV